MTQINTQNIIDSLSSITETSDVFVKNIIQEGGDQNGGFGMDIERNMALVCSVTVCIMTCTLICILYNKSMC